MRIEDLRLADDRRIRQVAARLVLTHAARIGNPRGHPYRFYQKLGFVVVGVMPDANGRGGPAIYMPKRIAG
jgi:hypothetical protein